MTESRQTVAWRSVVECSRNHINNPQQRTDQWCVLEGCHKFDQVSSRARGVVACVRECLLRYCYRSSMSVIGDSRQHHHNATSPWLYLWFCDPERRRNRTNVIIEARIRARQTSDQSHSNPPCAGHVLVTDRLRNAATGRVAFKATVQLPRAGANYLLLAVRFRCNDCYYHHLFACN